MPAMILGLLAGISVTLIIYALRLKSAREKSHKCACFSPGTSWTPPFEASAYLERIESVHLSILRTAQPVDWTITLWLGLDGLRIDPDGTSKWIRRPEPSPPPSGLVHSWAGGRCYGAPDPPYLIPTPPPPGVQVLYADNRIVECCCQPLQAIQQSMDQIRTENEIKRLEALLDQCLKKQEW